MQKEPIEGKLREVKNPLVGAFTYSYLTIHAGRENAANAATYYQIAPCGAYPGEPWLTELTFQNGLASEVGPNGLTSEALLAVVLDRLRGYQAGNHSCRENALAITKIEEALLWLKAREMDRQARNVYMTYQK